LTNHAADGIAIAHHPSRSGEVPADPERDFGEEVDLPEAWQRLSDLATLVRMLLGLLPEDPDRDRSGSATELPVAGKMSGDEALLQIPKQQSLLF